MVYAALCTKPVIIYDNRVVFVDVTRSAQGAVIVDYPVISNTMGVRGTQGACLYHPQNNKYGEKKHELKADDKGAYPT